MPLPTLGNTLRECVASSVTGVFKEYYPTIQVYLDEPIQGIVEPYVVIRHLDTTQEKVAFKAYRRLVQLEIRLHF